MGIPIIGDIIGVVKDLAGKVIVDKDKKNEILYKLQELADKSDQRFHEELMGQIEVNKIEAASSSLFVAGWRPAIGWMGAAGLGYTFVLSPFIEIAARSLGYVGRMPMPDASQLMTLITAMLGVGAMRSYEKVKGVATSDMTTKNK